VRGTLPRSYCDLGTQSATTILRVKRPTGSFSGGHRTYQVQMPGAGVNPPGATSYFSFSLNNIENR
jgi:hypothetical protein